MRFAYKVMIIVIIAISFSGCKGEPVTKKADSQSIVNTVSNEAAATSVSDPSVSVSGESTTQEEVIIKASDEKPLALKSKDTVLLDGLLEGEEYIEVIVKGEIFDFEQIALIWDESKNELKEKETVKSIKKLTNKTLVIKTYQPDGIPSEKLKWKSRAGKTYEYIIGEKNSDDGESSSTKFDMSESSTTLLAEINEKINPALSEFTFSIYGKKKDDLYSVNKIIIKNSTNEMIQQLDFDFTETPDGEKLGIEIEDMNFDGYKDIRIQQALPAAPNIPYYYWLWDKKAAKYVRSTELEEITSPEFDSASKTIKSSSRDNAFTYYERIYKYIDGIPTLTREIKKVADSSKNVWNITIRELNGKEMKVVKEYTEPL